MGDKISTFTIGFDGDAGDVNAVLAAFKKSVQSAVSDLQATTSKIALFSGLEDDVQKAAAALADATAKVAAFKTQIDAIKGSGGTIGADLAAQFKLAQNAADAASRSYNSQVTQLTALQTKLSAAGVNTGSLASEQLRLADALKVATAAAAQQSAKGLLGFTGISDIQPQVTALTKAFDTLRLSGTLSGTEIAAAQELLNQKIASLRSSVSQTTSAFATQGNTVGGFLSSIQAKVVGLVAVVLTIGSALKSVVDTSRDFTQGLAEIGTVTELSDEQLKALGESAKTLALRLGIDVVQAVQQLKDLIRSGIDPDNALLVLAASAEMAKASQQDLGAVVKVGTQLIQGYGVQVGDLQAVFDLLFQGMKDGGPTFTELADSFGPLLSVAKLANIPLNEIGASLKVMIDAGLPAGQAITDLTKIISKVNTKAAVSALSDLGIQSNDLVDLFTQLGAKGLDLNQILNVGLADKRSVAGLAALTSGAGNLRAEMDKLATSSGSVADAQAKIANTPKTKLDQLSASYKVLATDVGEAFSGSGELLTITTAIVNGLDAWAKGNFDVATTLANIVVSGKTAADTLAALQASAANAALGVKNSIGSIAQAVQTQINAVNARITDITNGLQTLVTNLQAEVTASQALTSSAITDLNARAAAQIAALDKSTASEQATADATLAIQTKLASDRLALIVANAADVLKALDDEAAAELALAKQNGTDIAKVDQATAQAKLAALATIKGQLTAALNDAVAQEQSYVTKINDIDAARVAFSRDIQQKIDDIRNEGLSGFDQYIAKTDQIKQLLADAQTQFALGGDKAIALGTKYTKDAEDLAVGLKTVVDENGVTLVSALDVQQTKLGFLKTAQDQVNQSFADQAAAANKGKDASVAAIDAIAPKLADITAQYDALNAKVAAGLAIKITTDEAQISKALADLDAQLAEKARLVPIQIDLASLSKDVDDVIAKLKSGVAAGVNTQLDDIEANLAKIAASAPELKLDVGPATTKIEDLKTQIDKIDSLTPHLTVDSNVADVQAAIDKLKLPTESTHTVNVVVVGGTPEVTSSNSPITGFAQGGIVGGINRARAAWRGFAGGGFTFPTLASPKVPGVGSGDTVPAALPRGAFVMRRAAADHYGDGIMGLIARGARFFATGGFVSSPPRAFGMNDRGTGTTDSKELLLAQYVSLLAQHLDHPSDVAPVIDPKLGYQPGDSFQGNLPPPITFDVRAVPPALVTAANVLAYAKDMLLRVGQENPLLGALGDDLLAMMKAVQANPYDAASITQLLRDAETLGANPYIFSMWGKTASSAIQQQPEWFYDWLEQTHAGDLNAALASAAGASGTSSSVGAGGSLPADYVSDFAKSFFSSANFGQTFYAQNPLATIKAVGLALGGHAQGTDTVNAMLTPGEYVISAPAASAIGPELLHAMNDVRFSRDDLASMLRPPAPRRPVMHFAEGGPVGDLWGGSGPKTASGGGSPVYNFTVYTSEKISTDSMRRAVVPFLNDINRRSR